MHLTVQKIDELPSRYPKYLNNWIRFMDDSNDWIGLEIRDIGEPAFTTYSNFPCSGDDLIL